MQVNLLVVFIAFVSVFVTAVSLLTFHVNEIVTVQSDQDESESRNMQKRKPAISLEDSDEDILIFIQISDLHISAFEDPSRFKQLKEFCSVNLPAIKPKVVIASGDLTDAKTPSNLDSRQFESEWKMYKEIWNACGAMKSVQWLDIRGNHDTFNVINQNSSKNYFRQFGVQGSLRPSGSYMTTVSSSNYTKYAFVAVDATPAIGPKRILNFVGQLDDVKMTKLEKFRWSADHLKVNGSIWFGHYPTSSISSVAPGLRQVASKSLAYLCGHFHSFYGVVPHMYTKHHSGLLELELADWKWSRMYRVGVLDQGLFSFTDVVHNSWPVIIVTNPKAAVTVQPNLEPFDSVFTSTHIRLLIFSPSTITQCQVKIDEGRWRQCQLTGLNHPLFTVPWEPEDYTNGLHTLYVRAKDRSGSYSEISHQFALDGSKPLFPILSRVALMMDVTTLFQAFFGLAVAFCVVPLCMIRVIHQAVLHRWVVMYRFKNRIIRTWLRKLWILSNMDCLFYPFVGYNIYLLVGPWWYGELVEGKMAWIFAWGTFLDEGSVFLPGDLSYFHGFWHVAMFNGPMVLLLAYTADMSFQSCSKNETSNVSGRPLIKRYLKQAPFSLFMMFHVSLAVLFWIGNGFTAFVVCPFRTWAVVLAAYLWKRASNLTASQLQTVFRVWK